MRKTGRIKRENNPANSGNQDVLSELKKISEQLQRLNSSGKSLYGEIQPRENYILTAYKNNVNHSRFESSNNSNANQAESTNKGNKNQSQSENTSNSNVNQSQLESTNENNTNQSQLENTATENKQNLASTSVESSKGTSISKENAAQILASAQYELSYELEASLNKLRQVIQESEKVAQKISSLLDERQDGNT